MQMKLQTYFYIVFIFFLPIVVKEVIVIFNWNNHFESPNILIKKKDFSSLEQMYKDMSIATNITAIEHYTRHTNSLKLL